MSSFFLFRDNPEELNYKRRHELALAIQDIKMTNGFPSDLSVAMDNRAPVHVKVKYTLDEELQKEMQRVFHSYSPDYGAMVVMDATTGKVLSMISYAKPPRNTDENLALKATFPSASVFKVVTAAAALSEGSVSPNTVIPVNGSYHTLYKGNIFKNKVTRWTRFITLKDAFAHSVNGVFGKLGVYTVGPGELRKYAERFGFNREIASDLPIEAGRAKITDDPWPLAEVASGFNRDTTMSPLQGALIAAAVVNDGKMMEPYIVESANREDGKEIYSARPKINSTVVDPQTATEIRSLMRQTIIRGTSRTSFRRFAKGDLSLVDVGGKTGSLTGTEPRGKYDWFIGFAELGTRRIAVAAMTINEKYWVVKSSYLARLALERYFKNQKNLTNDHL